MSTVLELDDGVLLLVLEVLLLLLPQPASATTAPTTKIPAFLLATKSTTPSISGPAPHNSPPRLQGGHSLFRARAARRRPKAPNPKLIRERAEENEGRPRRVTCRGGRIGGAEGRQAGATFCPQGTIRPLKGTSLPPLTRLKTYGASEVSPFLSIE